MWLIWCLALGLLHDVFASEVIVMNAFDFNASLSPSLSSLSRFVLFCDREEPAVCEGFKSNLYKLAEFDRPEHELVEFYFVFDFFLPIVKTFSQLDNHLPKYLWFDPGGVFVPISYFQTSLKGEFALERFVNRMLAPVVFPIQNETALERFLSTNPALRNVDTEESVSFVFIEPEQGSLLARSAFYYHAKFHRSKRFFAHIRLGQFEGDWPRVCRYPFFLPLPAILRVEPHVPTTVVKVNKQDLLPPRAAFSHKIVFSPHNFRDIWETADFLIIGLFSTRDEQERLQAKFEEIDEEEFWVSTMDRNEYRVFLLQFVEDSNVIWIRHKTLGIYWTLDSIEEVTPHLLDDIKAGKLHAQYESGFWALPRLFFKAIRTSHRFLVGTLLFGALMIFAGVGFLLLCGADRYWGMMPPQETPREKQE